MPEGFRNANFFATHVRGPALGEARGRACGTRAGAEIPQGHCGFPLQHKQRIPSVYVDGFAVMHLARVEKNARCGAPAGQNKGAICNAKAGIQPISNAKQEATCVVTDKTHE